MPFLVYYQKFESSVHVLPLHTTWDFRFQFSPASACLPLYSRAVRSTESFSNSAVFFLKLLGLLKVHFGLLSPKILQKYFLSKLCPHRHSSQYQPEQFCFYLPYHLTSLIEGFICKNNPWFKKCENYWFSKDDRLLSILFTVFVRLSWNPLAIPSLYGLKSGSQVW